MRRSCLPGTSRASLTKGRRLSAAWSMIIVIIGASSAEGSNCGSSKLDTIASLDVSTLLYSLYITEWSWDY